MPGMHTTRGLRRRIIDKRGNETDSVFCAIIVRGGGDDLVYVKKFRRCNFVRCVNCSNFE